MGSGSSQSKTWRRQPTFTEENGPRSLAYASALEDLGRMRVAAGGDKALATGSFDGALSITVRTGAEWDSARLRGRLRRLGVRRRHVGSERPKTGWASLTDPEMDVRDLGRSGQDGSADRRVLVHLAAHREHAFETYF